MEDPPKTVLIASPNPTEGKTTVAVNLAMTYAQNGKDTVVVDADLRRPMIHRAFRLPNRHGLAEVLQGSTDMKSTVRSSNYSKLSVITSGSPPSNPSLLLSSDKMMRFIAQLKQVQLISIIDSPPFMVSDASQIAAKVDGVILVVQPGKTSTHSLAATLEQLERVGANILGVVFNRIPRGRNYYYGNYQHYSKYYSKGNQGYYAGSNGNGNKPSKEKENKPVERKLN